MKLFFTALVQMILVGAQTIFVLRLFWPGIIIGSFGISFIWTYNVKRIAFATIKDRLVYSFGATTGVIIGVSLAHLITTNI